MTDPRDPVTGEWDPVTGEWDPWDPGILEDSVRHEGLYKQSNFRNR